MVTSCRGEAAAGPIAHVPPLRDDALQPERARVAEVGLAVALKISLKRSARLTSRSVAPFHLITVVNDKVIAMKLAPASSVRGDIEDN